MHRTRFQILVGLGLSAALWANTAFVFAADSPGDRYASVLAEADDLAHYNEQLAQQLESQQAQLTLIGQQLTEIEATATAVAAQVRQMFEAIESFIASDLPFLDPTQAGPDSRSERMNKLREVMTTEGVSIGEQYRRLMEAYQIELEYGRTMASYKGTLDDGREASFLRVGRVSLAYRTLDGKEAGYWDAEQKAWVVDNDFSKAIEKAVQVATKEIAPDLVTLPVPAPREVQL
jgi:Protein of unknown function (DUF3450)